MKLSKRAEDKKPKLNYPLSEEEKWITFDKYVKIIEEDPTISQKQLYDLKLALQKIIWGNIND